MSWPERIRSTASCTVRMTRDHAVVEDARPGIGQQDLRLECEPVQGVGRPAVDRVGAFQVFFELVERINELGRFDRRDRLTPAQAREKSPMGPHPILHAARSHRSHSSRSSSAPSASGKQSKSIPASGSMGVDCGPSSALRPGTRLPKNGSGSDSRVRARPQNGRCRRSSARCAHEPRSGPLASWLGPPCGGPSGFARRNALATRPGSRDRRRSASIPRAARAGPQNRRLSAGRARFPGLHQ